MAESLIAAADRCGWGCKRLFRPLAGNGNLGLSGAMDLACNVALQSAVEEFKKLGMESLVEAAGQIDSRGRVIGLLLLLWGACRERREKLPQRLLRALRQSRVHFERLCHGMRAAYLVSSAVE
jgi:hypothetical protein